MSKITNFKSAEYAFLSNMYVLPNRWCAETEFQSRKTLDTEQYSWIQQSKNGYEAKSRGRKITLRPDWNDIKLKVMLEIVRYKFTNWPELGERLIRTGDSELIEMNTWGDKYWGTDTNLNGQNNLGKILMQVRKEIK